MSIITITIDTDKMVQFFKKDITYGQRNNPYKADNFCNVTAQGLTKSDIRNVFVLQADTVYQFQLLNVTGSNTRICSQLASLALSIIQTNIPNEDDWSKIFDLSYNKPRVDPEGRLIFSVNNNQTNYFFEMKTQHKNLFQTNNNLQYHIAFQINVEGEIKLAVIDPLIANTSDEHR
jgi:hypothetical protein